MLRRMALASTDVSGARITSIVRIETISDLLTRLAVSSSNSVPEDDLLHIHRRENLKPYK
jgi:hypothetical protein